MPSRADTGVSAVGEAVDAALRALRHRDRTAAQIDEHLAACGFDEEVREETLVTLMRTGVVDDARYAEGRASTLGGRGAGDAFIRHDLSTAGLSAEEIERAVAVLAPESERAARIVARRGATPKTARYLAGKGFSRDVVTSVVAHTVDEALG